MSDPEKRPDGELVQRAHKAKDDCWRAAKKRSYCDNGIAGRLVERSVIHVIITRLCADPDPNKEALNIEKFYQDVLAEIQR